jgi:hypothetical protein
MKRGVEDHNQTSDSDTSKESLNQYIVERIIGKREVGKITQYCIKWEGFPIEQATWEPLEHLTRIRGRRLLGKNGPTISTCLFLCGGARVGF